MKQFFTTTDLLAEAGLSLELTKNGAVTQYISAALTRLGYTQRIIRTNGRLERLWGREWAKNKSRTVKKKPLDPLVFQRLDSVLDQLSQGG